MYNHAEFVLKLMRNNVYRTEELAPNVIVAFKQEWDECPDTSYLDIDPDDEPEIVADKKERWRLLEGGAWGYVGVIATLYVEGEEIDRDSLWGIESDSGKEYFKEIEDDMLEGLKNYREKILDHIDMLYNQYTDALSKFMEYTSTVKVLTEPK